MPSIWIEHLEIGDRTAEKIVTKHNVLPTELRSAIECVEGLEFVWDEHPERGWRAILEVRIRKGRWLVVLYPDRAGRQHRWHLGSAYEIGE